MCSYVSLCMKSLVTESFSKALCSKWHIWMGDFSPWCTWVFYLAFTVHLHFSWFFCIPVGGEVPFCMVFLPFSSWLTFHLLLAPAFWEWLSPPFASKPRLIQKQTCFHRSHPPPHFQPLGGRSSTHVEGAPPTSDGSVSCWRVLWNRRFFHLYLPGHCWFSPLHRCSSSLICHFFYCWQAHLSSERRLLVDRRDFHQTMITEGEKNFSQRGRAY